MNLLWINLSILLSVLIGIVNTSPILNHNEAVRNRRKNNNVENLFFISEIEEQQLDDETLNNAVIEKVKTRILNSLHLKSPPKSHPPVPSLQTFHSQSKSWTNNAVTNPQKHQESEFLNAQVVPNTCFGESGIQCLRFQVQIPSQIRDAKENSAELWLYKQSGVTEYKIVQIIDEPNQPALIKSIFHINNQTELPGWTRLEATEFLNRVSGNVLDLEVYSEALNTAPIEAGMDRNPLLIVNKEQQTRVKRGAGDCDRENSTCCRKKFYVSFKDIGWDDWVVQPEGYNANICKGSCTNRLDLAEKHHAHVLLRFLSKEGSYDSDVSGSVHCTPKSYKPLSIIYTDEKGLKVISNLPDMSVSECACS